MRVKGRVDGDVGGGHGELVVRHGHGVFACIQHREGIQLVARVGRDGQRDLVAHVRAGGLVRIHRAVGRRGNRHGIVDGGKGRGHGDGIGGHGERAVSNRHNRVAVAGLGDAVGSEVIPIRRGVAQGDGIAIFGGRNVGVVHLRRHRAARGGLGNRDGVAALLEGRADGDVFGGHGELVVRHGHSAFVSVHNRKGIQLIARVGRDGQSDFIPDMRIAGLACLHRAVGRCRNRHGVVNGGKGRGHGDGIGGHGERAVSNRHHRGAVAGLGDAVGSEVIAIRRGVAQGDGIAIFGGRNVDVVHLRRHRAARGGLGHRDGVA